MARPNRPAPPLAKVPNPYKEDKTTAAYFDNTGDGGIRCVSAAVSITPTLHVIISAPDIIDLQAAWKELTVGTVPLDVKKAVVTLYKYEPPEETAVKRPILVEAKPEPVTKVVSETRITRGYLWFYHPESDCCFIEFSDYEDKTVELISLGPADRMTVNECKLLMRKAGMERRFIDKTEISTTDPIPF